MRKTAFAEIFVFASFGNRRFSKIRTGASYSSFFRTRPDSRKLVPTRSDPNFCEKSRFFAIFIFARFGNCRFTKIRIGASYSSFFRTRLDSQKLIPTRNSTRKFGKKFGMQGPTPYPVVILTSHQRCVEARRFKYFFTNSTKNMGRKQSYQTLFFLVF